MMNRKTYIIGGMAYASQTILPLGAVWAFMFESIWFAALFWVAGFFVSFVFLWATSQGRE